MPRCFGAIVWPAGLSIGEAVTPVQDDLAVLLDQDGTVQAKRFGPRQPIVHTGAELAANEGAHLSLLLGFRLGLRIPTLLLSR